MTDLESYLRCLAHRRRRHLLYHLRDRDVTTVDALCADLAGPGPDPASVVEPGPDDVALELRHQHLPALEELSVVDYDPRSGVVRVLEVPPELEELLEVTYRLDGGG